MFLWPISPYHASTSSHTFYIPMVHIGTTKLSFEASRVLRIGAVDSGDLNLVALGLNNLNVVTLTCS